MDKLDTNRGAPPLYLQISQILRRKIVSKDYLYNEIIPSETELQKQVMEILRNASSISGVPSCVKQGRWHSDGALRGGASGTVSAHSENEVWQAADV